MDGQATAGGGRGVMDGLTRVLAGLLLRSARLLPAGRRDWAEAVRAEAREAPAGPQRLWWLTGGLWLVAREAGMVRRIGYGLGLAAVAAGAACTVWLSWPGATADPATPVNRARVIVMVAVLAGLPWVARRRGVFGPVGDSIAARVVRVGGCAAVCALVLVVARLGAVNVASTPGRHLGAFGWGREAADLALIAAFLASILVITARRPQIDPAAVWICAAPVGLMVFAVAPVQLLITLYVAGILAATSRWSPVAPQTLAIGTGAGAAGGLVGYALTTAGTTPFISPWLVLPVVGLGAPAATGLAAAWRTSGPASPAALRQARVQQGIAGGAVTAIVAALLISILAIGTTRNNPGALVWLLVLVFGPVFGVAAGSIGGAIAADHPREPRPHRPPRLAPALTPARANRRAVADARGRMRRRSQARELARADPALARELQIGRPEVPREYDDGGLVDVNHVPGEVLASSLGLTSQETAAVVAARELLGRFISPEEVSVYAQLSPERMDALRDWMLFA